ncbi:transcription factor binding protein [Aureococcus anophagefferens]|uniref:Transcription factor binding protein n=1 Tax=Aureococcus anophagefferens TaxID=44056 RepID=A0ABR1GC82_AURAN
MRSTLLVVAAALARADDRPDVGDHAAFARYMVNRLTWATLSTISEDKEIKGYPFGNPVSIGDNATGTPYMCEFVTTAACDPAGGDPENPPCSRLVLTGEFKKVDPKHEEWAVAAAALKSKHPAMDGWGCFGGGAMSSHAFFLAKLEIRQAWLINMYGGPAVVSPKDYYAADAPLPAKSAATGRAAAEATATA